jgi:membrane fusion protein, heavy metal efflux system
MNYRAGLLTGIVVTAAVAALGGLAWATFGPKGSKTDASKPPAPASVAKILKEDELLTITLTADAEKRIGIVTAKVEEKSMPRSRTFGGDVTAPPGQTILVAAPLNGTLRAPAKGVPLAGSRVKRGDAIFELLPLLSPDARTTLAAARVDAEGQVNSARVQVTSTKVTLDRAKQLLKVEGGRQRDVDDAQALYDAAVKTLEAAQARLALLNQAVGDADKGTAAPLTIEAPTNGLLRAVSALPEQNVPSGAALFEVVNLDPVWVRVPVFVGEAGDLVVDAATVGPLSARPTTEGQPARSVSAPPSANALAGTVDLFFTLANPDGKLRPGERVGVTLTMKDPKQSLTLPWGAVIHDVNGGTWVYENTTPHVYVRRRVEVRHVQDGMAVLKSGPKTGTTVVTVGAAELFGTEVGFSK